MTHRATWNAQRHILRAMNEWPKDTIRPELQFQKICGERFDTPRLKMSEADQLRQANALHTLVENRYKRHYEMQNEMLSPMSAPRYYFDVVREIQLAPLRTPWERFWLRIKGMFRMS
ncbi:hypothetical protein F5Y16DRAFT_360100 [Xylariaceae sp. FL0255]|nr:hypothetical protein F5Y16DRAFT_360100 [Xylariaceae sp. FL0255]